MGVALLRHGEWLSGEARMQEASAPLTEARQIFEGLGAVVLLDRVRAAMGAEAEVARA